MRSENQLPDPIKDLIIKFLQKEASDKEAETLENWLRESEANRKQFDEISDTFQAAVTLGRFTPQKIDHAWMKFSNRLKHEDRKTFKSATLFHSSGFKVAASILLIAVAGVFFGKYLVHNSPITQNHAMIQTNVSNKTKLTLPDSSVVWLNANSSLKYDTDFGVDSRQVALSGEAFFDVRKGEKEFIVSTPNIVIHVKGTKFNVNTLSGDGNENTTLEEGHVVLQINGTEKVINMKPGDQVLINSNSKKATIKKVIPSYFSAWKEDRLVFENESLGSIALMLENRYQISIDIDSVIANRENISMTIEDESIEEVMELIRLSSSLRYEIRGHHIFVYE